MRLLCAVLRALVRCSLAGAAAWLAPGCGGESDGPRATPPPAASCAPGEKPLEAGGCQPAGLPADMPPCPAGETSIDGACEPAGVPPAACAPGFAADGARGCTAILPAACPDGTLAVPGDASCHSVAACAAGDYGDIPDEADAQHVRGDYPGSDSDGTIAKPWRTIQQAVDHAAPGGIVAVASGTYLEAVLVAGAPVRIWGRCPSMVHVSSPDAQAATIAVGAGADGAEIHRLAVTGPGVGVVVSGARAVSLEQVYVHDTGNLGVVADTVDGATDLALRRSLVERTTDTGVALTGVTAEIEASVVRETAAPRGYGVAASTDAAVDLRGSVLEANHDSGLVLVGAQATVEGSVVRDTQPNAAGFFGRGITAQMGGGRRSSLTLTGSLVANNREMGISIIASDATMTATVVRDTWPRSADQAAGYGVAVDDDLGTGEAATIQVKQSVVQHNHVKGISLLGSEATVEATIVRDTAAAGASADRGCGIDADASEIGAAHATVSTSLLAGNVEGGICAVSSEIVVESTLVQSTVPGPAAPWGRGVTVQARGGGEGAANATLRACVIEDSRQAGIVVAGSILTVESSVVRSTHAVPPPDQSAGLFVADSDGLRSTVLVQSSVFEQNDGAGIMSTDSDLVVEATVVQDSHPTDVDTMLGRGIFFQAFAQRPQAAVRWSRIERNTQIGIGVAGADAEIEASVIRATLPLPDGTFGHGIHVQLNQLSSSPATLAVRSSLVSDNVSCGIVIASADATIDDTVVSDTAAQPDGRFGDGVTVVSAPAPAHLEVHRSTIRGSARAGVANFGAALALGATTLDCNAIDLDGEQFADESPSFHEEAANVCGCRGEIVTCAVQSAHLEAPQGI